MHPTTHTTRDYRLVLSTGNGTVLGAISAHQSESDARIYGDGLNNALSETAKRRGMQFRAVAGDAHPLMRIADPVAFANEWAERYAEEMDEDDEPDPVPVVLSFDVMASDRALLSTDAVKLSDADLLAKEHAAFRLLRLGEVDRLLRLDNPPGIAIATVLLDAISRLSALIYCDDPSTLGSVDMFGLVSVDGVRYDPDMIQSTRALVAGFPPSEDMYMQEPPYVFGLARHGYKHGTLIELPDGRQTQVITLEQLYADVCRAFVWTFSTRLFANETDREDAVRWIRRYPSLSMGMAR